MSGILFVVPGHPFAFNYSGAASRSAQNFFALHSLGKSIHVLRFHVQGQLQGVSNFEATSQTAQNARQIAASWQDVELPLNQPSGRLDAGWRMLFDPLTFEFPQARLLARLIQARLQALAADLIWAEHSDSVAAVWSVHPAQPWIYSQTDMRYLIRSIRTVKSGLYQKLAEMISRNIESVVSRGASVAVTGSTAEQERLKKMGLRNVVVIPVVNHDFPDISSDVSPPSGVNIVHLGSLETTANRHGLISYLSLVHPVLLIQTPIPLMVIGDVKRVKPPLSELLLQPRITCAGHVADLASVLRPYDIAILPYGQDSGYRTKLPLLMGYAQAIVATRAAVAGSPIPGLEQACILLDRIQDFPETIARLAANPAERKQWGLAARAFAEEHFRPEVVQPLYTELLRQVVAPSRPRQNKWGR